MSTEWDTFPIHKVQCKQPHWHDFGDRLSTMLQLCKKNKINQLTFCPSSPADISVFVGKKTIMISRKGLKESLVWLGATVLS